MKGPTNSSARPNIRLLNVSATFDDNPDTSNNTEFPYRASIEADGVSEYMSATVMFSQIQATSGNFATYCQTDEDVVYIYSKTDVGTITIPAVSCDLSVNYINVDNIPTEDSQAVITSGGVYDNCVRTSGNQTVNDTKTFVGSPIIRNDGPFLSMENTAIDRTVAPSSPSWQGVFYKDKNDKIMGILGFYRNATEQSSYLSVYRQGSTDVQTYLSVMDNGTNGWVTAPYRAFNTANSSDVVTIGSLTPTSDGIGSVITWVRSGNVVTLHIRGYSVAPGSNVPMTTGLPIPSGTSTGNNLNFLISNTNGDATCLVYITSSGKMFYNSTITTPAYGTVTYVTQ